MTKADIRDIQQALREKGFDPGPIDGLWGRKTARAVIQFKSSVNLRARSHIGPLTRAALFDGRIDTQTNVNRVQKEPIWFRLARTYLGLREYRGNRHNPKILEWWSRLSLPFRNDETPWCAGFVCGVLEEAGIKSTRSASARSFYWDEWGEVSAHPALGSIACMWRVRKTGKSGHVGFVAGRDVFGNLMVLGGNQQDRVSIRPFSQDRILSYHWPSQYNMPKNIGFKKLPIIQSDGRVSEQEI